MLASLIETIAAGRASIAAKKWRRMMIDYSIAGVAFLLGFGFLVAAGFIYLLARTSPFIATLSFGVGFVILSLLILVLHRILSRVQSRRRMEEQRSAEMKSFFGVAAAAIMPALLRRGGGRLELIAPLAALALYTLYKVNAPRPDPEAEDEE